MPTITENKGIASRDSEHDKKDQAIAESLGLTLEDYRILTPDQVAARLKKRIVKPEQVPLRTQPETGNATSSAGVNESYKNDLKPLGAEIPVGLSTASADTSQVIINRGEVDQVINQRITNDHPLDVAEAYNLADMLNRLEKDPEKQS